MRNIAAISHHVNKTPDLVGANARLLQLRQQFAGEITTVREKSRAQHTANFETAQSNVEQQSGWLASIQQIFAEQAASLSTKQITQPPSEQKTVAIPMDILTALLRNEMAGIGRIWLLGRHLDPNGSGWIPVDTLRQNLTRKASPLRVCGWRRLRQLLQTGKGVLWERDDYGRLWLFGLARVAANLNVARFSSHAIALPLENLIGSIATVKATFLAAFHAGREAMPISRATLRQVTGVPERTQQEYDKRVYTKTNPNISLCGRFSAENQAEHTFKHGGAAFTFTDKHGKHGVAGAKYHARQLPNSYQNSLETVNFGRKRKLNQQLKQQTDLVIIVARGNDQQLTVSSEQKFVRRYFDDGKLAAKSLRRLQNSYLQASEGVWHELTRGSETNC